MEQAIRRLKRYGDLCLVAGAAEGLGRAFAEAFAACGLGLILVDRDRDKLEILKSDLTERAVPVRCVHLDLSTVDSAGVLMEIIRETGCRMLVYNAAFSKVQPFLSNSPADLQQYVNVNVSTPLQLVHSFCSFHSGKPGSPKGIILMSSMAGGWGNALLAPYGATKAFIHILAEALYHELKQDGFDILSSITGATRTPGYLASSPDHTGMPLKLIGKKTFCGSRPDEHGDMGDHVQSPSPPHFSSVDEPYSRKGLQACALKLLVVIGLCRKFL
jgi:short-subunit dehydrogenase